MPDSSRSLAILDLFRDFYTEIIRQKDRIARMRGNYAPLQAQKSMAAAAGGEQVSVGVAVSDDEVLAQDVRGALLTVLQAQSATVTRSAGAFGLELYAEAQYVMASIADEVFLNLEWPGRPHWRLLESSLFQTHAAGEIIFQRIDELLRQGDVSRTEMATIYFTALALGFKGRYRGMEDQSRLDNYRNRLFAMIYRRAPEQINRDDVLLPQNYLVSSEGAARKLLPDPRRWYLLVVVILLVWLVASHFVWTGLTDRVARFADCMQDPTQSCTLTGAGGGE